MLRKYIYKLGYGVLFCVLPLHVLGCIKKEDNSPKIPLPEVHARWTLMLEKYVNDQGLVDYARWKEEPLHLRAYLELLRENMPTEDAPPQQQLAYWINLYNAFTVDLVLQHYPVDSMQNIQVNDSQSPWDIPFINLPTGAITLNHVEHEIIRPQFNEPRIHFALVCAAISCPVLRREAYLEKTLEAQLENQAQVFLQDPTKNLFSGNTAQISEIFDWFAEDFTKGTASQAASTLVEYLNKYLSTPLPPDAAISYITYEWDLNAQL